MTALGEAAVLRPGDDVTIVGYSIMAMRALEAAERLEDSGISAEVIDLRSLRPLDIETVRASVKRTGRLLVTHEAPAAVGIGAIREGVIAPTINLDHPDLPDCDLDYVPNKAREARVDTAMVNGFGFGGQNAVAVFRRFEE